MVDQVATTVLSFDARLAKAGAEEFQRAGELVVKANDRAAASFEVATKRIVASTSSQTKMLESISRSVDPFGAAVTKAARQVEQLNDVIAKGGPNAARAAELIGAAQTKLTAAQTAAAKATDIHSASLNAHAKSSNAASFAARDFGIQLVDVGQAIATGQPLMRTLIQQGAQVAQVMGTSGVSAKELAGALRTSLGSALAFVLSPLGLLVTGSALAVGGLAAIAVEAEKSAERIGKLRNELSLVRTDFATSSRLADETARHLASTSPLSTADSRAGINSVYGQGNIFTGTPAQAEALVLLNAKISKGIGEIAINAQRAGQIVVDPAGVLATLLKDHPDITAFNQQTVDQVKHLQEIGQQGEAVNRTFGVLQSMTKNVTMSTTPLTKAWEDLKTALTDGGGKASLIEKIGLPVLTELTSFLHSIEALIVRIESLWASLPAWMKSPIAVPSWMGGSPTPTATTGAGSAAAGAGMVTIRSPSGAAFTVAAGGAAAAFQGLINDLEARGYVINNAQAIQSYRPGATVAGTGQPSMHASGLAIDLPHVGAQNGTVPPDVARELAARYGLKWGGDFRTPDQMHFGFDSLPLPTGGTSMAGAVTSGGLTDARVGERAAPLYEQSIERQRQKALEDIAKAEQALQLPNLDEAHIRAYSDELDNARKRLYEAVTAGEALNRNIALQNTAEQRMADAWGKGAQAASQMAIQIRSEGEARALYAPGTEQYRTEVERLTAAYSAQAAAQDMVKAAQQGSINQDTLAYIQRENDLLLASNDVRVLNLAHMKAEQDLRRSLPNLTQAQTDKLLAQNDAIAKNSLTLQNQQRDLNTVAGAFSTAFDTIGNSITQALISGQGAAVNWRNVMTSVAQQILQAFLKLAVLNPILNGIFGQNNSTLGSVFGTLNTPTPGSSSTDGGGSTGIWGGLFKLGLSVASLFNGGFGPLSTAAGGTITPVLDSSGAITNGAALLNSQIRHAGGLVGSNDNVPTMLYPAALFANAPRFHNGLGGNEFAAILQRGERVLTERQQSQVAAAASGEGREVAHTFNFNFPSNATPDQFRRSGQQVASSVLTAMSRAKTRSG